jgi:hypothetical protein
MFSVLSLLLLLLFVALNLHYGGGIGFAYGLMGLSAF